MKDLMLLVQDTMASTVVTREVLKENHHKIKAIILATQIKENSFKGKLKISYKLLKNSSFPFLVYKIFDSKVYFSILKFHKLTKTKNYKNNLTRTITDLATHYNIPIIKTGDITNDDLLETIHNLKPKFILCHAAQIIKKKVFDKLGDIFINAHGSYLPKYRGPAQYIWYLMNKDENYGVTIHYMSAGLDTGDIIFQKEFPIEKNISAYNLHYKLANNLGYMFNKFITISENFTKLPRHVQNHEEATHTRLPSKQDMQDFKKMSLRLVTFKDLMECI